MASSIEIKALYVVDDWKEKLEQIHHINKINCNQIIGIIRFSNCQPSQFCLSTDILLPPISAQNRNYNQYSLQIVLGRKKHIWKDEKDKWHFIKFEKIIKSVSKYKIKLKDHVLSREKLITPLNPHSSFLTFHHCWILLNVNTVNTDNKDKFPDVPMTTYSIESEQTESDKTESDETDPSIPDFKPKQSDIHNFIQNLSPKYMKMYQRKQKLHQHTQFGQLVLPTLYDMAKDYLHQENRNKYLYNNYKSRCKIVNYSQMELVKPCSTKGKWSKYNDIPISNKTKQIKMRHGPKMNNNINILSEMPIPKFLKQKAKKSMLSKFEPSADDIKYTLKNMKQQDILQLQQQCNLNQTKNNNPFLVTNSMHDVIRIKLIDQRQQIYFKLLHSTPKTTIFNKKTRLSSKKVTFNLNMNSTKIVTRWIQ